jgi:hypothetical protein
VARDARGGAFLFDSEKVPTLVEECTRRFPEETQRCVERAEHAVRHQFVLQGNEPAGSYVDCGADIDWHTSPNGDREGLFTLNRHRWFGDLARAYRITGDERFAAAFVEQVTDWIRSCPPPSDGREHFHDFTPWKTLNGAIRMADHWIYAYHLVVGALNLTAEFHTLFERSVYEHGENLSRFIFDETHNHTLKEMAGLLTVALSFPHFDRAAEWRETALGVLERAVAAQTEDDGTHYEATPGYHQHSLEWVLLPMIVLRRNGIEPPESIMARLRSMLDVAVAASLPDGSTLPFGDSDRNTHGSDVDDRAYIVGLASALFDVGPYRFWVRPSFDLLWLVGDSRGDARGAGAWDETSVARFVPGSEAEPAPPRAFHDGGLFVLGSFDEELHVALRNGPLRHGHPHADLLSIVLYAGGRLWLTDTGKYTYNEGPERKYLKGTRSHNTVSVDWEDQAAYRDRMSFATYPEYHTRRFVEGDGFAAYDGEQDGYRRLPMPVTHRRIAVQVGTLGLLIVDWLCGRGRHQYDQYFHVPVVTGVSCSPLHTRVEDEKGTLRIIQLEADGLSAYAEESWVSPAYGERVPSTRFRFTRVGDVPARFVTWIDVCSPSEGGGAGGPAGESSGPEPFVRLVGGGDSRTRGGRATDASSAFLSGAEGDVGVSLPQVAVEVASDRARRVIRVSEDAIEVGDR